MNSGNRTVAAWLIANPEVSPQLLLSEVVSMKACFQMKRSRYNWRCSKIKRTLDVCCRDNRVGIFTGSEREAIARGAEADGQSFAGNVAARGLGGSGAGAQVIAEAQQAPSWQHKPQPHKHSLA